MRTFTTTMCPLRRRFPTWAAVCLRWLVALATLATFGVSSAVSAQERGPIGQQDQARRAAEAQAAERAARVEAPQARLGGGRAPPVPFPVETPCFTIRSIVIDTPLPRRLRWVARSLARFEGRCAGHAGLDFILKALQAEFLDRGLVTTRAGLPQQDLASGVLHVAVVPGISAGVRGGSRKARRAWRIASPVHRGDLISLRAIEQGLDQMRRIPGRGVSVDFAPGSAPGDTLIDLHAKPARPIAASVALNNLAGATVGRWQVTGQASARDLLGLNEIASGYYNSRIDSPSIPADSKGSGGSLSVPWGWWTFGIAASANRYGQRVIATNRATIGQGSITLRDPTNSSDLTTLNRDLGAAQVVTEDKESAFTVYADLGAAKELAALVKGDTDHSVILQTADVLKADPLALVRGIGKEVGKVVGGPGKGKQPPVEIDAPQTVIDPITGETVVVGAALADQIERRRAGKQIDAEIAAGIRNQDGTLRDGSGAGDAGNLSGSADSSTSGTGEYRYNPEYRETFSRSINTYWRDTFEADDAALLASENARYVEGPDMRQAYADRDIYLLKLDAYATQMVDRPIMYGILGIAGAAAAAPLVPWMVGASGATGWTATGLTLGGEAVAGATANVSIRYGFGQQNTLQTFAGDAATIAAFGVVARGVVAVGAPYIAKLFAPGTVATEEAVVLTGDAAPAAAVGGNTVPVPGKGVIATGDASAVQSATIQQGMTVKLTQPVTLTDGTVFPSGSVVTATENGYKVVGVDGAARTYVTQAKPGSVLALPAPKGDVAGLFSLDGAVATESGLINASKVCANSCTVGGLTAKEQALASQIAGGADTTGALTESLFHSVVTREGYSVLEGSKYGSNNGFDIVLQDAQGNTIILVEAKQIVNGMVKLDPSAAGGMPQMSEQWVNVVVDRLNGSPAANAVTQAQQNKTLVRAVAGVDRATGKVTLIRLK